MTEDVSESLIFNDHETNKPVLVDVLKEKMDVFVVNVDTIRNSSGYGAKRQEVENQVMQALSHEIGGGVVGQIAIDVITDGCVLYGVDFDTFEVAAEDLGRNRLGRAGLKRQGQDELLVLGIDRFQAAFLQELVSKTGLDAARDVSRFAFTFIHEMAHIGQLIHARKEHDASFFYPYDQRPTEINANEVALNYCKDLLSVLKRKSVTNTEEEMLLAGLPEIIEEAEKVGRPGM